MKYKRPLFARVTIDGWQICELVRVTNFVKHDMKSNLHDVLPIDVEHVRRTFSLWIQSLVVPEHC